MRSPGQEEDERAELLGLVPMLDGVETGAEAKGDEENGSGSERSGRGSYAGDDRGVSEDSRDCTGASDLTHGFEPFQGRLSKYFPHCGIPSGGFS